MSEYFKEKLESLFHSVLMSISTLLLRIFYTLSWATLRDIEHNKVVKSTYVWLFIVPISAKLFSKVNGEFTLLINNQLIIFDLALPFSWEALFFSACFFVTGNLLVKTLIPETISNYKDYSDFSDSGKTAYHLKDLHRSIKDYDDRGIARLKRIAGAGEELHSEDDLKNEFSKLYLRISYGSPVIRAFCTFCYILGFMFIVDITHQNLIWVVSYINLNEFKDQLFFSPVIDWLINAI